jgi:hypothetical protein
LKNIIYHDLKESTYIYNNKDLVLHFSSEYYLKKFKQRIEPFKQEFLEKMRESTRRVVNQFEIDMTNVAEIQLYSNIEIRGFYIIYKGEYTTCQNQLLFRGEIVKNQN